MRRIAGAIALTTVILAGCGGGSAPSPTAAPATAAPTAGPTAAPTPAPTASSTAAATVAPTTMPTTAASLPAGSIGYRVVNEGNQDAIGPVDVFVRTQGSVQASLAKAGMAEGDHTAEIFPPEPGGIVVLRTGKVDPTCVTSCEFEAEASTNAGEGKHRILIVRGASSTELWADPNPGSVGTSANALRPADPSKALVIIEAAWVADSSAGLRVSWGAGACADPVDAPGLLLGGTNVLAYSMDPAGGALSLYPASDTTCAGEAQAGPFAIPAASLGSRSLTIVWGSHGDFKAVVLPLP